MGFPSTSKEQAIDRLLLLYLIDNYSKRLGPLGITKLQKFTFLSAHNMLLEKLRGFSYNFFVWNFGPMSKEVYQDIETLVRGGLIHKYTHTLTKQGRQLLQAYFQETCDKNEVFYNQINSVLEKYGHFSLDQLKQVVYKKTITLPDLGVTRRIEDLPKATDILCQLPPEKSKKSFELDDELLENLELEFELSSEDRESSKISSSIEKDKLFGSSSL